jgi:hydroxymethylpyrimidine pyrophosphatase-like HAD family hydrolase
MIIAVDFDGTIVEHRYPAIGAEIPFAIETLKKLAREQHRLILWTVRKGKLLEEAVEFCRKRGLEFYAVNRNYPEETEEQTIKGSRKLKADVWIDDRNVGGLPEWGIIYQLIHNEVTYDEYLRKKKDKKKPKGFIGFFTQLFNKQDYTKNLTDL